MSAWDSKRMRAGFAVFAAAMAGLAAWAWLRYGASLVTAVTAAVAIACAAAALYVWRLSRHALRTLDDCKRGAPRNPG